MVRESHGSHLQSAIVFARQLFGRTGPTSNACALGCHHQLSAPGFRSSLLSFRCSRGLRLGASSCASLLGTVGEVVSRSKDSEPLRQDGCCVAALLPLPQTEDAPATHYSSEAASVVKHGSARRIGFSLTWLSHFRAFQAIMSSCSADRVLLVSPGFSMQDCPILLDGSVS